MRNLIICALTALAITSCSKEDLNNKEVGKEITFTETESIIVDNTIANQLGFENLIIESGEYHVKYDDKNHGIINFKVSPKSTVSNSQRRGEGFGIRIRIANRVRKCSGGVGFRCGFVQVSLKREELDPDRDKLAKAIVSEDGEILQLEFIESVDWELLANS